MVLGVFQPPTSLELEYQIGAGPGHFDVATDVGNPIGFSGVCAPHARGHTVGITLSSTPRKTPRKTLRKTPRKSPRDLSRIAFLFCRKTLGKLRQPPEMMAAKQKHLVSIWNSCDQLKQNHRIADPAKNHIYKGFPGSFASRFGIFHPVRCFTNNTIGCVQRV